MKFAFVIALYFSTHLFAATTTPVGDYFVKVGAQWEKMATVQQQGQKLVAQFSSGCLIELNKQSDGSFMGSCTLGKGYSQVMYFAQLRLQGQSYNLFYKMMEYGDSELGTDRFVVAVQRK